MTKPVITNRCYDCSGPSDDTVCAECLSLAADVDREERRCREDHGERCQCWRVSEEAMAYDGRRAGKVAA